MTSFFFLPLEKAARGADEDIFCCLAIVEIAFENVMTFWGCMQKEADIPCQKMLECLRKIKNVIELTRFNVYRNDLRDGNFLQN